jgi:hypothetical protein
VNDLEIMAAEQDICFPENYAEAARDWMVAIEEKIAELPGARFGDSAYPLKHSFAEGLYIREIFMPAGEILTSKIHKKSHPAFILRGCCSVFSEKGIMRIRAPFQMITPAGTKRVILIHEDVVWVTVHKTDKTDLLEIEEEIISKSFDDYFNYQKQLEGEIL